KGNEDNEEVTGSLHFDGKVWRDDLRIRPPGSGMSPAVFLDRDGVLIDALDLICRVDQVQILAGVPGALGKLKMAGFKLVVVTNQPVIARGMATEEHI